LNVAAESPHYFGDVFLVPFDETAVRIGIALPALADVIDVASGGDGLVCADCQAPQEARDTADRLGQRPTGAETPTPIWTSRGIHI